MKNILITGAGGFVGSHLIELLEKQGGAKVFASVYGEDSWVKENLPEAQIIKSDLTKYEDAEATVLRSNPEVVFHLAALSVVHDSIEKAQSVLVGNTLIQLNLLEAVRRHAPKARIVAVCSANEYGLVEKNGSAIDENTPLKPLNPYAVSKITQEYIALQYHLSHKMDVVILRPFNHTGERQIDSFVVPAFAKQIAEIEKGLKEPVIEVGNLDAVRDFTDVKDMVRAYVLASEKCESGEVYNIGSGQGAIMSEILHSLLRLSKVKIKVMTDPKRMRPSDVPTLVADATKFRKTTGWEPQIPLEVTLNRILEFWRKEV